MLRFLTPRRPQQQDPTTCSTPERSGRSAIISVFVASIAAVLVFELGYAVPLVAAPCMVGYGFALAAISSTSSARVAFYTGLFIGTSVAALELRFMASIFGPTAFVLWLILGLWTALFLLADQSTHRRFPEYSAWLAAVLWVGFEYFRGELYHLRFSWVTPGLALVDSPWQRSLVGGQYLVGGLLVLGGFVLWRSPKVGCGLCCFLLIVGSVIPQGQAAAGNEVVVAGMQLESPDEQDLPRYLDRLHATAPHADLLVLSEYSLQGTVPEPVLAWCDQHDQYLIIGGRDWLDDSLQSGPFYNTAFVVGPDGTIVHRQAKSVPIQFFVDGLPAKTQSIWDSPFGKIAFPICYDLSYTRVVDRYIINGANLIINPTMDAISWGEAQHRLHARIPKCRALEYRVPVFRLASSGISLAIDDRGRTLISGSFPGQEEVVVATLTIPKSAHPSIGRWLGPICTALTVVWVLRLWLWSIADKRSARRSRVGFAFRQGDGPHDL